MKRVHRERTTEAHCFSGALCLKSSALRWRFLSASACIGGLWDHRVLVPTTLTTSSPPSKNVGCPSVSCLNKTHTSNRIVIIGREKSSSKGVGFFAAVVPLNILSWILRFYCGGENLKHQNNTHPLLLFKRCGYVCIFICFRKQRKTVSKLHASISSLM